MRGVIPIIEFGASAAVASLKAVGATNRWLFLFLLQSLQGFRLIASIFFFVVGDPQIHKEGEIDMVGDIKFEAVKVFYAGGHFCQ